MLDTRPAVFSIVLLLLSVPMVESEETEVNSMKFGAQAVMTAQPGKGAELAEVMLKASELVAGVGGCELYVVQISAVDDTKILITEVWESQEAHQASLANPEIRELITNAKPLIAGMEYHPAKPLGGLGVEP